LAPESSRIKILPESVANKISAGEVVERPASVVKELVENALDAGAGVIRVDAESGGSKLLRVTDDGCGMTYDEALLSLERHATSKISTEADLFGVRTMGFRGEALPSIAAVSRFEMLTRVADAGEGVRVRVEGGVVKSVEPAGCAPGTQITVRDIFYNVPARRKFLKSKRTEIANITDVLSRIAVAYPGVHFHLTHDGREVLEAQPARDIRERISDAMGGSALASMVDVDARGPSGVRVHGMVGLPDLSRSNTSMIYIYVNSRPVKSRLINHALGESYRSLIPRGRYPVAVLFVELPPEEVDVNVHPAKAEVKFKASEPVYETVRAAVRGAFARIPPQSHRPGNIPVSERMARIESAVAGSARRDWEGAAGAGEEKRFPAAPRPHADRLPAGFMKPAVARRPAGYFSELKVLGQLKATYIVCQSPEGLMLIDQHAAHERTAFEQLRKEYSGNRIGRQALLFPETVEFGPREAAHMERHLESFRILGFDIEEFGPRTYRVSAQPAVLSTADPRDLLLDTLDSLARGGSEPLEQRLDEVFARMACHAVVRANRRLTDEEIRALLARLDEEEYPLTCPHGRPISVNITFEELEKMFGRR